MPRRSVHGPCPTGVKYDGEFKEGKKDGMGVQTWADGMCRLSPLGLRAGSDSVFMRYAQQGPGMMASVRRTICGRGILTLASGMCHVTPLRLRNGPEDVPTTQLTLQLACMLLSASTQDCVQGLRGSIGRYMTGPYCTSCGHLQHCLLVPLLLQRPAVFWQLPNM